MAAGQVQKTDRASDGLWAPARRGLTTGLVLSTTFIAAEALAVITIMPRVARDLGGLNLYGWVFSAFMLGSVVGTVAAGRDADRSGPARPFVAGLVLFGAGLAVAGLAPSMPVLVLGRVLQGLGAGAVPAVAYVAIGRSLLPRLRARMLAVLSSAWVLPGLLGPLLSAEVTQLFGWRWVFLGLIPFVGAAGLLALPALVRLGRPSARPAAAEQRLLDAVRAAAGSGLLLGGLSSDHAPLAAALILGGVAIGVPALRRLLPAGTLTARRGLPATILSRGALTFAFFGADAFVTFTITIVLHHSTATAGLAITSSTLAWTLGSWLQVRLSRSRQARAVIRLGLALLLLGITGMLIALRPATPIAAAVGAWTLAGLGIGLAYSPISLLTLRAAPEGRDGWASASLNLADVLGTALGTGAAGAAIVLGADHGWSTTTAVTVAFALAAAAALAALALTRRLPLHDLDGGGAREAVAGVA
ncbi:MAG: MFS transporter [Solirubrobacteraceae bacterium]